MVKSRGDLVRWALEKAEEYLLSARQNVEEERLFVAAEEIFRAMENSLEALLYHKGVKRIAYPGKEKEFTGRLALQFLVRDELASKGIITSDDYNQYLRYASDLHRSGYSFGTFEKEYLENALEYVEKLFYRAQAKTKS